MKDTKSATSTCSINFQIHAHEGYMLMACEELPGFRYHKDIIFIPKGGQLLELFGCLSAHLSKQGLEVSKLAIHDSHNEFKDIRAIPKSGIRLPAKVTIRRTP